MPCHSWRRSRLGSVPRQIKTPHLAAGVFATIREGSNWQTVPVATGHARFSSSGHLEHRSSAAPVHPCQLQC